MIFIRGINFFSSRPASSPFSNGIPTSTSSTSGFRSSALFTNVRPSSTHPTTSYSGSSSLFMPAEIIVWSSANKIVVRLMQSPSQTRLRLPFLPRGSFDSLERLRQLAILFPFRVPIRVDRVSHGSVLHRYKPWPLVPLRYFHIKIRIGIADDET